MYSRQIRRHLRVSGSTRPIRQCGNCGANGNARTTRTSGKCNASSKFTLLKHAFMGNGYNLFIPFYYLFLNNKYSINYNILNLQHGFPLTNFRKRCNIIMQRDASIFYHVLPSCRWSIICCL